MKNTIFLVFALLFISCKKEVQKENPKSTLIESKTEASTHEPEGQEEEIVQEYSHKNVISKNVMVPFTPRFFREVSDHQNLLGFYVGSFDATKYDSEKKPSYSNKINLSINHVKNDSIFGHSVVAGNARPFQGIIDITTFKAKVVEPGDDKYDGIFEFFIYPKNKSLKGTWVAYNSKLAVSERKYKLSRKKFTYNQDQQLVTFSETEEDGYMDDVFAELYSDDNSNQDEPESEYATIESLRVNASNTMLTDKDLENLYQGDLEIIRNSIYARHGYSFKNRRMRYFFDSQIDWYIPVSTDVRSQLTDLEKKNIDLIKRYEQHAERYYDYFGR
ncbi:YARHG domain-containing protein [uncultured Aquimarina sp.]|uniref:YARHG domain-containing protein n=1 Tax=uncultured Aquimarina sp. TaxID=575652 RepID=UPI00260BE9F0|nr:YARHG domain-containing protein [uncultured Aquimarina sp.]